MVKTPKNSDSWEKIKQGGTILGEGIVEIVKIATKELGKALKTGSEKFSDMVKNIENQRSKPKEKKSTKLEEDSNNGKQGVGKKIGNGIKNGAKKIYKTVDAGDKKLGKRIEDKMKENGKDTTGKVGHFVRTNIAKGLIGISLLNYGGGKVSQIVENIKEINNFEINKLNKNGTVELDLQYAEQGVELLRDGPLTFYIVRDGETISEIRDKLSKISEFSYLKDNKYSKKTNGFNTPEKSIKKGFYLPIPVKMEDREISVKDFKKQAKHAIKIMEHNEKYGRKVKEAINEIGEKQMINAMAAYARSETAEDRTKFTDPIGSVELHRREPGLQSFSFSYYHILMEKNADGKTAGPGLKARLNLGLTEGDCYSPENSCLLFLAYCFEKKQDPGYFFRITNENDALKIGKTYNGSPTYGYKLYANYKYALKN